MRDLNRRQVLRGTIAGSVISVGLPLLDCHLNANGTALAASGAPLPARLVNWYQPLGLTPGRWVPAKTGAGYEHNIQLKVIDRFKSRTNVISGLRCQLDGRPHATHNSPVEIVTTGIYGAPASSFDSNIADVIGKRSRFRSLEINLAGSRHSWSKRSATVVNPSEPAPTALYKRIFVEGFRDPNAAEFTPDPLVLARKSVLSAVADRRAEVAKTIGASDRVRLDEYFTALREVEQKLAQELEKPAPLPTCSLPGEVAATDANSLTPNIINNSKIFAGLLAHAFACDQTRVFNVDTGSQAWQRPGLSSGWHTCTHEEPVDEALGVQKEVFSFLTMANQIFADFLTTLDGIQEGPSTALDRSLVLWQSDYGEARTHSMENMPVIMVGSAGGRFKTGVHLSLPGDPITRVGLTVQQAFGVPMASWSERSNQTNKPLTDFLA